MMNTTLKYNVIDSGEIQNKAFIMIHGWQGNKDSFINILKLINISDCSWFFPEAPYMVGNDPSKRTWSYEKSPGEWEVEEPKKLLKIFIEEKVLSKFDPKDVFIMGFSQGAAVCYELILSFEHELGGIFPIAGFMRDYPRAQDKIDIGTSPKQSNTPILIGHGRDDDIVSVDSSKKAFNLLKEYCNNIELCIYNGRHKIGLEYLKKVREIVISETNTIER